MENFIKSFASKASSTVKKYVSNTLQFSETSYFKETDFSDTQIKQKLASSYEFDIMDALKIILAVNPLFYLL